MRGDIVMSQEAKLYDPSQLDRDEWRQLQSLQRDAFSSVIDRPQEDIDFLVQWDDPNRFYDAHIDPNSEVGKRFNPNQSYTHPRVAVATESREPIAFAYTAHNVSGASPVERLVKRLSVVKNYLWLREFAVKPEYQRQGVAKQLGLTVLKDAIELQPVAAYVWPDEIDFLPRVLSNLGFSPTSERQIYLYGENKPAVRQVRMQAPSVRGVVSRLG
jgi:GNAT superfamily N-acetyltransferase